MLSQYLSLILVVLLIYTASAGTVFAQSAGGQQASIAEQVKQNIQRLGVGQEAQVRVKLHDGTELVGYVSQAGADSFTLIERRAKAPATVEYKQVKRISGGNRSIKRYICHHEISVPCGLTPGITGELST